MRTSWDPSDQIFQKIEVFLFAYFRAMKPNPQFYALADRYKFSLRNLDSHLSALAGGGHPEALTAQRSEDVDPQLIRKGCP